MSTKIEWADMTINPIVGCSHCSPGCDNCYAERFAARLEKHPNPKISSKYTGVVDERGKWTGVIDFDVSCLVKLPRKPNRIFVGSMCDLFHDSVMDSHLEQIMGHIGLTCDNAHHTFMLLTKRPERMREFFTRWKPCRAIKNIWLGVTVCNQAEADEKIPLLLQTPAAMRFVSVEPMLGPVDLSPWDVCDECGHRRNEFDPYNEVGSPWVGSICYNHYCYRSCEGTFTKHSLDWVICGGETGPGARPMHPDWVRGLRDQCVETATPFFFKGWGEWETFYDRDWDDPDWRRCPHVDDDKTRYLNLTGGFGFHGDRVVAVCRVGKRRSGRLLDGREWNEIPEVRP